MFPEKIKVQITKIDRWVDVDLVSMNDEMQEHVVHKGIDNILNDANANATKVGGATDDEIWGLSMKALQALYDGTFRSRGQTGPKADPVRRYALEMIERQQIRPTWTGKVVQAEIDKAAKKYLAEHPMWLDVAKSRMESEAREVAEIQARIADAAADAAAALEPKAA